MIAASESAPPSRGVLELRDVVAGYGSHAVLRGLNLHVPPGKIVALIGADGAGKTTLLRVASGLQPLIAGDVLLDNRSVTRARAFERSRAGISLIPEGAGVFPSLTVRENLVLQLAPGSKDHHLESALDVFPILKHRLRQRAGTMSGGEQRMLALARCFLAKPKVVLIDELSTGLAPQVIEALRTALALLTEQGVGLLVAEQYEARALAMGDLVYVLAQGRLAPARTT